MSPHYSRRSFLTGVLACGTLSASTAFLMQGRQRQITLKLATGADATGARRALIDEWNKKHPDVFVEYKDVTKSGTDDEHDSMLDIARAGDVDIINLDIIHIAEFAASGLINPVRLDRKGRFLKAPLKAVQVVNAPDWYWAVPFNTDVGMLFARNLEGDPPSLREIVKGDAKVSEKNGLVGQLRLVGTMSYEPFVVNVLEHALAQRSEILDKDSGVPVYDLDVWKEALGPLQQAMRRDTITATGTEQQSLEEFWQRQLRYMRNWPVRYRELVQKGDQDAATGQMRVSGLPVGILGGASLAIVAKSRNQAAARELIDFLTDDSAQARIAKSGFAPTLRATYDKEELKNDIPYLNDLRTAVENSRFRPIHPNYRKFSEVVRVHVGPYLHSDQPLTEDFVSDMQAAFSG